MYSWCYAMKDLFKPHFQWHQFNSMVGYNIFLITLLQLLQHHPFSLGLVCPFVFVHVCERDMAMSKWFVYCCEVALCNSPSVSYWVVVNYIISTRGPDPTALILKSIYGVTECALSVIHVSVCVMDVMPLLVHTQWYAGKPRSEVSLGISNKYELIWSQELTCLHTEQLVFSVLFLSF